MGGGRIIVSAPFNLTPAEVHAFFDRDRLDTVGSLVRDKGHTGVKEVLTRRIFRLHAFDRPFLHGLNTERGPSAADIAATSRRLPHQQRFAHQGIRRRPKRSARHSHALWP